MKILAIALMLIGGGIMAIHIGFVSGNEHPVLFASAVIHILATFAILAI